MSGPSEDIYTISLATSCSNSFLGTRQMLMHEITYDPYILSKPKSFQSLQSHPEIVLVQLRYCWKGCSILSKKYSICWPIRITFSLPNYMSPVTRKPVFRVCDQVRLKLAWSAIETSYKLEISDIDTRDVILSRQWITKILIRLCGCAGWSASLFFAYGITGFHMAWRICFR